MTAAERLAAQVLGRLSTPELDALLTLAGLTVTAETTREDRIAALIETLKVRSRRAVAVLDAATCDYCRQAHGTTRQPPHRECTNELGCRCFIEAWFTVRL